MRSQIGSHKQNKFNNKSRNVVESKQHFDRDRERVRAPVLRDRQRRECEDFDEDKEIDGISDLERTLFGGTVVGSSRGKIKK